MSEDQAECPNQTGSTCSATRCECNGIKPMESLTDIKNFEKGEILKILKRGTIKRSLLLDTIPFYISDRRMRDLVSELIKDGECIQSGNDGYSLIQTREQLDEARKYLDAKASAIAIRKNTLLKNWNTKNPNQQYKLEL